MSKEAITNYRLAIPASPSSVGRRKTWQLWTLCILLALALIAQYAQDRWRSQQASEVALALASPTDGMAVTASVDDATGRLLNLAFEFVFTNDGPSSVRVLAVTQGHYILRTAAPEGQVLPSGESAVVQMTGAPTSCDPAQAGLPTDVIIVRSDGDDASIRLEDLPQDLALLCSVR